MLYKYIIKININSNKNYIMIKLYITIQVIIINFFPNLYSVINSPTPNKLDEYVAKAKNVRGDADSTPVGQHKTMHSIHAADHRDKQVEGSTKSSFRTAEPRKPNDILVWASITDGLSIAHGLVAVIFPLAWVIFDEFTLNIFKQFLN